MSVQIKFDQIVLAEDSKWWAKYLERAKQINDFIETHGKGFQILQTYDQDGFFHISVLMAEAPCLYYATKSLSDKMSLRCVKCITKDAEAQTKYDSLTDSSQRREFGDLWYSQGDKRRPSHT